MKLFHFNCVCIFVFIISFFANAQCPPGWTPTTQVFGPDASGCSWEVDFCTKCVVTGTSPSAFRILSLKPFPLGSGCVQPDKVWLDNQLLNYHSTICSPKPCDEGCTTYIVEYPTCWQCHTLGSLYQGNYIYTSWFEPCPESGYCQITTKFCRETTPPYLTVNCPGWNNTYQEFNVNCLPIIPLPDCPTEFEVDFEGEIISGPCFKLYDCYE